MKHLLELHNINVYYGGLQALNGVNLHIDAGEVVAIMGPNGAGKSTVLKTIFGLTDISNGDVIWRGDTINPIPTKVVHQGIAFVPQGRRVFTHLTIEENLEIGGWIVKDKKELRRRMDAVMETFPALKKKRKEKSGVLSGGQQQMLAVARGLMVDPKILLLDEPTLGLSPKLVKDMFATIKTINETHKTAIVIVEHNVKSLLDIVQRAYVLDKGTVVYENDTQTLLTDGVLEKVFVGKPLHLSNAKTTQRKIVFKGKLFTVAEDDFIGPSGTRKTYERVFRVPSVYVLPMVDEKTILMLREFRISQGKYLWRIPAGRVDKENHYDTSTVEKLLNPPAKTLRVAAQRELREETGYKAKQIRRIYKRFMGESIQAPAWVFLAQDLSAAPLEQDDDEKIQVHKISLKKAYDLAVSGEIGEELMALMIIRLYKKTL